MMEYRVNRRTGDRVSVIGLGTSYIAESDEKTAIEALRNCKWNQLCRPCYSRGKDIFLLWDGISECTRKHAL